MEKVKMPDGSEIGFEGAEWYMDDDIRAELVMEHGDLTEQEFLDKYCEMHRAKYNEEFSIEVAKDREIAAYEETVAEKEKEMGLQKEEEK